MLRKIHEAVDRNPANEKVHEVTQGELIRIALKMLVDGFFVGLIGGVIFCLLVLLILGRLG